MKHIDILVDKLGVRPTNCARAVSPKRQKIVDEQPKGDPPHQPALEEAEMHPRLWERIADLPGHQLRFFVALVVAIFWGGVIVLISVLLL